MAKFLTESEIICIIEGDLSELEFTDDEEDTVELQPELAHIERTTGETSTEVNNEQNIPDVGVEVEVRGKEDDNDEDNAPLSIHSIQKPQISKLRNLLWRYEELAPVDTTCDIQFSDPPSEIGSPLTYYKRFVDDEIINNITEQTNLYSVQKNSISINTNCREIHQLLGIHMMMSVVKMPSYSMFWAEKTRYPQVADVMARNRFKMLRSCLHFNNNDKLVPRSDPSYDKLFKIRPFLDKLRKNFLQVEPEEHNSVDEFMIPLKSHTALKQYIKNKPYKWGVKVFARAGDSGFVYDFEIYAGKQTNVSASGLGFSSDIVMRLADGIPKNKNYKLYFDNWFSNYDLQLKLKQNGILSTGTVRKNRLSNCTLKSDKELKNKGRGSFDYRVEKNANIIIVKWFDNKPVHLMSTFVGHQPVQTIERWSVADKKYIQVQRPNIVKEYNVHMGGVDKQDMLIELYRTDIKGKRYYLRIIFHFLDLATVNAWLLYRRHCEQLKIKYMPLIDFKLNVAHGLLFSGDTVTKKRGRPPSSSTNTTSTPPPKRIFTPRPVDDVRFDGIGHWPEHLENKQRCKHCIHSYSRVQCEKCNMPLCFNKEKNCFKTFHCK